MEDLDFRILRVLQKNCRKSFRDIAKKVGSTTATVIHHVGRMEKEGIIKGYCAYVDYEKLGYGIAALIQVTVDDEKGLQTVAKAISDPHTLGIYEISGETDAAILAKFRSHEEFRKYVRKYLLGKEHVTKVSTQFVVNVRGEKPVINL